MLHRHPRGPHAALLLAQVLILIATLAVFATS